MGPGLTSSWLDENRDRRAVRQCHWVLDEVVGRSRYVLRSNLELDGAVLWPHHIPGERKIPVAEMRGDLAEVTKRRHVSDSHIGCLFH